VELNHRRALSGAIVSGFPLIFPALPILKPAVSHHVQPIMTPELDRSSLHVWFLNLDEDSMLPVEIHTEWLSREEKVRAHRYSHAAAQRAFILTRGHLRRLLGSYLGINPEAVDLAINAHGKPRLSHTEENQGLVFNVSHSGGMAVIVFGRGMALGVDVERLHPRRDLDRLGKYCLSEAEWDDWRRLGPAHRPESFIRYWNAKEAFVKATGRGIAVGLKQVVVAEDFQGFHSVPTGFEPASDWILHTGQSADYRYAVVHEKPERIIRLFNNENEPPAHCP
jgi:4'-phosphopantetheinyl transferase